MLTIRAPLSGVWLAPKLDQNIGAYIRQGQEVGVVVNMEDLVFRATVTQDDARLLDEVRHVAGAVSIRPWGRPGDEMSGTVIKIMPAGQKKLPSASLGFAGGGEIRLASDDSSGTEAAEGVFEVIVRPDNTAGPPLLLEQRVSLRFEMSPKPWAVQWWRKILQLVQRRFHI